MVNFFNFPFYYICGYLFFFFAVISICFLYWKRVEYFELRFRYSNYLWSIDNNLSFTDVTRQFVTFDPSVYNKPSLSHSQQFKFMSLFLFNTLAFLYWLRDFPYFFKLTNSLVPELNYIMLVAIDRSFEFFLY